MTMVLEDGKNQFNIMNRLSSWLKLLEDVWKGKSPERVVELCADSFSWYETPFSEAIITRETLIEQWNDILSQEDISLNFEILAYTNGTGIVRWKASFKDAKSLEQYVYDGIMQITLNDEGKCKNFIQWFNKKDI